LSVLVVFIGELIIAAMAAIDPTAIVDQQARLAEGVTIGPRCFIEGPVRIGPGTRLGEAVSLRGPMSLGERNEIAPGVCLGYEPQDRKFDPDTPGAGLAIGNDNVMETGVTIHRATGEHPTRLGDGNRLMADSHIGHDARCGNGITFRPEALLGGHVEMHDGVVLEERSAVHQFCRVGRLSRLGKGAIFPQDVPPFCVGVASRRIGGLNTADLERSGLGGHREALAEALALLYHRGYARNSAVRQIREQLGDDPLCVELAAFVEASERGITAFFGSAEPAAERGDRA
jgi:UDP-N-acetylglucosamine acyltransferase